MDDGIDQKRPEKRKEEEMIPLPLPIIVFILLTTSGIMVVNQIINFEGTHKKSEKKIKKKTKKNQSKRSGSKEALRFSKETIA